MVSKRAEELMLDWLERTLSDEEILELKEYLKDPECEEYFRNMMRADRIINDAMMKKVFEEYPELNSPEYSDEEIEEDIRKYGRKAKKGDKTLEFVRELNRAYQARQARKKFIKRSIIASLAVAAMVAVVLILWSSLGGTSGEKLYASYYEKHKFELYRSDRMTENDYLQAVGYYNEGNYEESIALSRQILADSPTHMEARFIYALSLQESGIIKEAMEQYQILIDESEGINERIYLLSAWYLGLCYVLEEEPIKALEYLNIAKENAGYFVDRDEVEELMREVGEI